MGRGVPNTPGHTGISAHSLTCIFSLHVGIPGHIVCLYRSEPVRIGRRDHCPYIYEFLSRVHPNTGKRGLRTPYTTYKESKSADQLVPPGPYLALLACFVCL